MNKETKIQNQIHALQSQLEAIQSPIRLKENLKVVGWLALGIVCYFTIWVLMAI